MAVEPTIHAQCRFCRHWQPKYSGVGLCRAAGAQDAKFWVAGEEDGYLLTKADFACYAFNAVDPDIKDEVL